MWQINVAQVVVACVYATHMPPCSNSVQAIKIVQLCIFLGWAGGGGNRTPMTLIRHKEVQLGCPVAVVWHCLDGTIFV